MHAKLNYLYLLLIFVGCLASSCNSDSPEDVAGNGSELKFTVSDLTRAPVTTTLHQFAVYGDMKSVENNTAPFVVFDKTEVTYRNNTWSYSGMQYWFPYHEYSFVAVHPISVLENGNNPLYADSKLSFTYTLPTTGGNNISSNDVSDILGATHRRNYGNGPTLPVSLTFSHLMSLINVAPALNDNVMSADAYIEISKLELTGLKNKATFSILPAPRLSNNQTDDRVIEVTGQEGEANLTIEFATPKKIMNHGGNVRLLDSNDAIIMLPQEFTADSQSQIILTYTISNETETKTMSSPLKQLSWESGKSYTYK
ncbi:MAG: fimbrillin family protein, partial [Muribaculaceae bacterium]|nr:fimbrillin family protein [Muribaculaceae bacterium]